MIVNMPYLIWTIQLINRRKDSTPWCVKCKNGNAISVSLRYFAYAALFDVPIYNVNVIENGANTTSNWQTFLTLLLVAQFE